MLSGYILDILAPAILVSASSLARRDANAKIVQENFFKE